jgi:hypothetical protein
MAHPADDDNEAYCGVCSQDEKFCKKCGGHKLYGKDGKSISTITQINDFFDAHPGVTLCECDKDYALRYPLMTRAEKETGDVD